MRAAARRRGQETGAAADGGGVWADRGRQKERAAAGRRGIRAACGEGRREEEKRRERRQGGTAGSRSDRRGQLRVQREVHQRGRGTGIPLLERGGIYLIRLIISRVLLSGPSLFAGDQCAPTQTQSFKSGYPNH